MADLTSSFINKDGSSARSRIVFESGAWLLNLGIVVFVLSLILVGGLFFYRRASEENRREWAKQVETDEAELRPDLLKQLTDLSDSLSAAQSLIRNHSFSSNALLLIQSVAHPSVQFSSLSFSRDSKKIDLSGLARSYQIVAEQVSFMEASPQVEKVEFGGLARNEKGLIDFRLAVIFKPTLLQLK